MRMRMITSTSTSAIQEVVLIPGFEVRDCPDTEGLELLL
jgi:hypothetical protein